LNKRRKHKSEKKQTLEIVKTEAKQTQKEQMQIKSKGQIIPVTLLAKRDDVKTHEHSPMKSEALICVPATK
jgi:hypothetical protein